MKRQRIEMGHRFLEAFAHLNDLLKDRAHRVLLEIASKSYEEGNHPM